MVERAVYKAEGAAVTEVAFNPFQSPFQTWLAPQAQAPAILGAQPAPQPPTTRPVFDLSGPKPFETAVRRLELELLRDALKRANYNQKRAAQLLGLTYHQFRGYYRKYAALLTQPPQQ